MKRRLYSNMKHMTTMFCVAITGMTLCTLMLRLVVFNDMVGYATAGDGVMSNSTGDAASDTYSINTNIRFRTVDAEGDVQIHNPENNEYPITVSIMLADTQDVLVYTGMLQPGESQEKATLNLRDLEEGTYECVAEVRALDPDDPRIERGKVECNVTVQIG